jgi:hypothetical protein
MLLWVIQNTNFPAVGLRNEHATNVLQQTAVSMCGLREPATTNEIVTKKGNKKEITLYKINTCVGLNLLHVAVAFTATLWRRVHKSWLRWCSIPASSHWWRRWIVLSWLRLR